MVETGEAHGVVGREMKRHTRLDGLGHVDAECVEAQAGARRASDGTLAAVKLSDLKPADGRAHTTADGELPALRWIEDLGSRIAKGQRDRFAQSLSVPRQPHQHARHKAHRKRPHSRALHARLLNVGGTQWAGGRGQTDPRDGRRPFQAKISRAAVRLRAARADGWYSGAATEGRPGLPARRWRSRRDKDPRTTRTARRARRV